MAVANRSGTDGRTDGRTEGWMDGWTDEKMEAAMGMLLRVGVILAAAVVILGAVLRLRQEAAVGPPDYHLFHGVVPELRSPIGIVIGAVHGDGVSIIQLGLLLLIATPIARVLFAVAGFLRERDWLYTGVSFLVLAILIYSLVRA